MGHNTEDAGHKRTLPMGVFTEGLEVWRKLEQARIQPQLATVKEKLLVSALALLQCWQ